MENTRAIKTLKETCEDVLSKCIGRMKFEETTYQKNGFFEKLICGVARKYLNGIEKLYDRVVSYHKLDRFVKNSIQLNVSVKRAVRFFFRFNYTELIGWKSYDLPEHKRDVLHNLISMFMTYLEGGELNFGYAQLNMFAELTYDARVLTKKNKKIQKMNAKENALKTKKRLEEEAKELAAYKKRKEEEAKQLDIHGDHFSFYCDINYERSPYEKPKTYSLDTFIVTNSKKKNRRNNTNKKVN